LGPTKNGTPTRFKVKLNGVAATIYPIPAPMASARIDSRGWISSRGRRNRSTRWPLRLNTSIPPFRHFCSRFRRRARTRGCRT